MTRHRNGELRSDLRLLLAQNEKIEKKSDMLMGTVAELSHELTYQAELTEAENKALYLKMQEEQDALWQEANECTRIAYERADRAETLEEIAHAKNVRLQEVPEWRPHYRKPVKQQQLR